MSKEERYVALLRQGARYCPCLLWSGIAPSAPQYKLEFARIDTVVVYSDLLSLGLDRFGPRRFDMEGQGASSQRKALVCSYIDA